LARKAYFAEFTRDIRKVAQVPIIVTGGIRRRRIANQVINSSVDRVGLGTVLAIEPNLPRAWQSGYDVVPELAPIN